MSFELHVDGIVEVKPLPSEEFSKETITLLADVHKTFIDWYRIKANNNNVEQIAVRYFESKGFKIQEQEESN